jgi:hypothetical protein
VSSLSWWSKFNLREVSLACGMVCAQARSKQEWRSKYLVRPSKTPFPTIITKIVPIISSAFAVGVHNGSLVCTRIQISLSRKCLLIVEASSFNQRVSALEFNHTDAATVISWGITILKSLNRGRQIDTSSRIASSHDQTTSFEEGIWIQFGGHTTIMNVRPRGHTGVTYALQYCLETCGTCPAFILYLPLELVSRSTSNWVYRVCYANGCDIDRRKASSRTLVYSESRSECRLTTDVAAL